MRKTIAVVIAFAVVFALSGCSVRGILKSFLPSEKVEYDNPADKWRNEWIYENEAKEDAINGLLKAVDSDDRSAFAELFAPVVKSADFTAQVDSFFEACPKGFSECGLKDMGGSGSGHYEYGDAIKTYSPSYTCYLDGRWYYISVSFCYQNTTDPDEVGITFFSIENLEAFALGIRFSEEDHIACRIVDESVVTARLIGGYGFVFEPTPDRSVTLEQMRDCLEKCDTLSELSEMIGMPNVEKKYSNATGYDYYYELTSDDGSPLYALIVTSGSYDRLLYGFVCTDEETLYDEFLMTDRTGG